MGSSSHPEAVLSLLKSRSESQKVMLHVAVGHSVDPESRWAIAEVIQQCQAELQGQSPQAGILFAANGFDYPLILDQIDQAFPDLEIIGCTTAGELSSAMGYQQDSITLMLFVSDDIEIHAGLGRGMSKDVQAAAEAAIAMTVGKTDQPVQFCIAIPDGQSISGDDILTHLRATLGDAIPIVGGLAGAQTHDHSTAQFFQTEVMRDAMLVLVFSGKVAFSHGVANGWRPLANPSKVIHAEKNVVYTIGEQSALAFYQSYLGQPPSEEYPLAVFAVGESGFYTRSPLCSDAQTGSVTFGGTVPNGAIVQLTEATRDEILSAAQSSLQQALASYPGVRPSAALCFSCSARRGVLGSRTEEEYQLIEQQFATAIPAIGFYTFGEIAPLHPGSISRLHNETFVTLLIGKAE